MEAVPSLRNLPELVTGLEVPGFAERRAASILLELELVGLALPGLAKPVIGRPPLETGLKAWDIPAYVPGLCILVPGRGTDDV
eukprot:CAMPEP_0168314128 /NCGR_PEP_ID=MMETSP0210-20121227/6518_1 /TAXON_ID=40633 /ORGANISM="Condylostoma magnum, Strain COL2" /LENGTH=82 /DNA_ID=CAMNT_0008279149 /DNA_START=967 /DNA_END=1215 /DNA_ORIENTATION=-